MSGQSSATPSSERTRKSEGSIRGQAPAKMSIEPPTAEYMSGDMSASVSSIG